MKRLIGEHADSSEKSAVFATVSGIIDLSDRELVRFRRNKVHHMKLNDLDHVLIGMIATKKL
ncbi:uncharacterized protein Dwil_GK27701 [Drosophila willistoni]|uniref:Uncharacterized protein n=1 Tax=Drosophila willistoni TaxID=7260 RepID=A0A0Q9X4R6_DROWI|nr:uncharacterized protein Dwil_GK27701 [Drosophila willistoni]